MSDYKISVDDLEKEVLVHLAHDRQELIDLLSDLAENMAPIVIDEETIDVRMDHSLYESLFEKLESFGFIEMEME